MSDTDEKVAIESAKLTKLATEINAEHQKCLGSLQTGLSHAVKVGELLMQAKALCRHGAWEPWVSENFDASLRTAQAYMRVAKRLPDLKPKAQRAALLTLREALTELAEPVDGTDANRWVNAEDRADERSLAKIRAELPEMKAELAELENAPATAATLRGLLDVRDKAAEREHQCAGLASRYRRKIRALLSTATPEQWQSVGVRMENSLVVA